MEPEGFEDRPSERLGQPLQVQRQHRQRVEQLWRRARRSPGLQGLQLLGQGRALGAQLGGTTVTTSGRAMPR
jgi:hypothetical protein